MDGNQPTLKHSLGKTDAIGSPAALQHLSCRALEVLENDRKRIARELRDSIAASLAAIKYFLEKEQNDLEKEHPGTSVSLKPVISHLVDAIKMAKRISAGLRPTTLDELGLRATLVCFCRRFSSGRNDIQVDYQIDIEEEKIPEDRKIFIYRIVKEAMVNAADHWHATVINTTVVSDEDRLRLVVRNDGRGFDPDKISNTDGSDSENALRGIREWVAVCGGAFEMDPQTELGTEIRVSLPLHDAARIDSTSKTECGSPPIP